jgi:hypothetical protein
VQTGDVTAVTSTTATMHGAVNANGGAVDAGFWLEKDS